MRFTALTTLALLAAMVAQAQAADAAKGQDVYKRCAVCHTDK